MVIHYYYYEPVGSILILKTNIQKVNLPSDTNQGSWPPPSIEIDYRPHEIQVRLYYGSLPARGK